MSDEIISNYTPHARQVLALSHSEAARLNCNFIGTEHLLLGLIKLGQGLTVSILQKMGLDLETVRMEVEKQIGTGWDRKVVGPIPFTPRVKRVLALARKEAIALNHIYVGTEHLLLGLLREGDGVAARVLTELKIDAARMRQEILKELDPPVHHQGTPQPLPHSARNLRIWELAQAEAWVLGRGEVIPEHFLLGILREDDNVATRALRNLGVDAERLREEVRRLLISSSPSPAG